MIPEPVRAFTTEDSNWSNVVMLRVSLNPTRQHTIHHCTGLCPPLLTECSPFDMIGFSFEASSYEGFKAKCQERGKESALSSYWMLCDHFAPYWFKYRSAPSKFPIDVSTVEDDCHPLPDKTNVFQNLCSSLDWMLKNQ